MGILIRYSLILLCVMPALATEIMGNTQFLPSELRALLEQDKLQEELFKLGFWKSKVEIADGRINIHEGIRYQLQITGQAFGMVSKTRTDIESKLSKNGLNERVLDQLVYQIRSLYRKNGFPDITVQFTEQDSLLICHIEEGKRVLVSSVYVDDSHVFSQRELLSSGNEYIRRELAGLDELAGINTEEISSILNPTPYHLETPFLDQGYFPYDAVLWSELKQYWTQMYARIGFLDAKVVGPRITKSEEGYFVSLRYRVIEGAQTLIDNVKLINAPIELSVESLDVADIGAGKPLNGLAIESLRTAIEQKLWNSGYPSASVKTDVQVTSNDYRVDVIYHIETGDRIRIEQVDWKGNVLTRDSVLARRLKIHVGDWFSLEKIAESRRSLLQSDLFDKVDIFLAPDVSNEMQRLVVKVEESPRTRVEVGLGASLEDGPRVTAILQQRNLFGFGISFRTRLQLNYPAVFYHMPFFYAPVAVEALDKRFNNIDSWIKPFLYTEGRLSMGLEYPQIPIAPFDVNASADINAAREIKPAYNLNRLALEFVLGANPLSWLRLSPQMEVEVGKFEGAQTTSTVYRRIDEGQVTQWTGRLLSSFDRRDSVVDPHRGFSAEFDADLGLGKADITNDKVYPVSYTRLLAAFNWYVPLSKRVVWGSTIKIGQIFNLVQNAYVPLFKRFYFGGTNSVRGFPEDQILPADAVNATGVSLGGNSITLFRNEIRFPIHGNLGGAIFADVGELLKDVTKWSFSGLAIGTGAGIRYMTPIGPLMFDVGVRLRDSNRPVLTTFWNSVGIHFSVGYP